MYGNKQVIPGPTVYKDKACRFCGYLVFGPVYECSYPKNVDAEFVDLIQGTNLYNIGLYTIRTSDDHCGVSGKWFKKRSVLESEFNAATRAKATNKPTIDEL